jgi:DNA polymerase/3'-5' exonuclease PolX
LDVYILCNQIEEYTFLCGGKDKRWIEQFSQNVNVVVEDQLIQEVNIIIELCCVGKGRRQRDFDKEIQELLRSLRNKRRWAVFMTNFSEVISKDGATILQVLEAFEEWKVNVRERGFQICFKEYHDKLLPTGSQPSASRNV